MQDQRIEQANYHAARDRPKVIAALKSSSSKYCTKASLINATGLSMYAVEDALRDLMGRFRCRLEVDEEKGEILYFFDLKQLRNQRSLLDIIGSWLRFILGFIFRLWITLMLFTFGLFYGLIVAVLLTGLAKNPAIILGFFAGFFSAIYELFKSIGDYFSKGPKTEQRVFNEKNTLQLVFAYVFGKPRPSDDYAMEKIILQYLQSHAYKITKTELLMLTGWSMQKLEEQLTQLIVNYRGLPMVTDEGCIVYSFPELELRKEQLVLAQPKEDKPIWAWAREPDLPKWGVGEASLVIGLVMFLGGFFSIAYSFFAEPEQPDFWRFSYVSFIPIMDQFFISFWTSYFSLVFCCMFYIVHFYHKWRWGRKNMKIARRYQEAHFLQNIFVNLDGFSHLNLKKRQLKKLAFWRVELGGVVDNASDGNIQSCFEQQLFEIQAVNKLRPAEQRITLPQKEHDIPKIKNKTGGLLGLILFTISFLGILFSIMWNNFGEDLYLDFNRSEAVDALKTQLKDPTSVKKLTLSYPPDDRFYARLAREKLKDAINLEHLTIDGAREFDLDLRYCIELETLHLKNVKTVEHFRGLGTAKSLKRLVVEDNGRVLDHVDDLETLKVLVVKDASNYEQSSTSMVSVFSYYSKVLDSITVHNLHAHSFNPQATSRLNCRYMSLTNLSWHYPGSGAYGRLDSLKTLVLDGFKESDWRWISGYKNLEEFYCRNCKAIPKLPKDFGKLEKLRLMDISGTGIAEIGEEIQGLQSLERMILSRRLYEIHQQKLKKYLPNTKFELVD